MTSDFRVQEMFYGKQQVIKEFQDIVAKVAGLTLKAYYAYNDPDNPFVPGDDSYQIVLNLTNIGTSHHVLSDREAKIMALRAAHDELQWSAGAYKHIQKRIKQLDQQISALENEQHLKGSY